MPTLKVLVIDIDGDMYQNMMIKVWRNPSQCCFGGLRSLSTVRTKKRVQCGLQNKLNNGDVGISDSQLDTTRTASPLVCKDSALQMSADRAEGMSGASAAGLSGAPAPQRCGVPAGALGGAPATDLSGSPVTKLRGASGAEMSGASVTDVQCAQYDTSALLAGLVVRELTCCPRTCAAVSRHNGGHLRLCVAHCSDAPLDSRWSQLLQLTLWEKRELEYMMSWLSTLGGAFSALGDDFYICAEIAGRISLKQLDVALRLGDPVTVARCKLYAALSLLQRHRYETAAALVRQQYRSGEARADPRLRNMCRGIWAKLVYERRQYLMQQLPDIHALMFAVC